MQTLTSPFTTDNLILAKAQLHQGKTNKEYFEYSRQLEMLIQQWKYTHLFKCLPEEKHFSESVLEQMYTIAWKQSSCHGYYAVEKTFLALIG